MLGAGSVGKVLTAQHKDLSSDPQLPCEKLGVVVLSVMLAQKARRMETGRF